MPYTLIELRVGSVQQAIPRSTAINKGKISTSPVSFMGLETDEQAESFHGGVERAILQFDSLYYLRLAELFPLSAHLFVNGGFGENFVVNGMNENNVCIGDIVSIGNVLLQVSQPRVPCFKLNHRFNVPHFARYVQDNFITGWFYRVLQPGEIQVNDSINIIERPNPEWIVAKVLHYLFIETSNHSAMSELLALESLGQEIKNTVQNRLHSGVVECWNKRLGCPA